MSGKTPSAGEYVQDRIGHWYKVLAVLAGGFRFRVQAVRADGGMPTQFTYGQPVVVGRSDLRID